MSGRAVLKTVSRGQALFALSCAESEFYGLTTAASESLVNEASSWILKSSWVYRYRQTPRLVRQKALASALVE